MTDPTPRRTRRGDPVTADEPMSTPDSGGLRAAVEGWLNRWADADDEWSPGEMRADMRRVLAAHPEPVPTPDGADDATVGEREAAETLWRDDRGRDHDLGHPSGWDCDGDALSGPHETCAVRRPATPPADDANRAPVSGGLDEGEREALAFAVCPDLTHTIHEGHDLCDAMTDRISDWLAARDAAWVERLAAVEADYERRLDHAHDHGMALRARSEAAEAERDTARREAGERIAQAIEADEIPEYGVYARTDGHRKGLSAAARIARADALTSDDGSGA